LPNTPRSFKHKVRRVKAGEVMRIRLVADMPPICLPAVGAGRRRV